MSAPRVTEDELLAYVDGCLPDERAADMERHLAEHPDDEARVRSYLAQNVELHRHFDAVLDEPVPQRLLVVAPRRGSRLAPWLRAAGLAAVLVTGGVLGWYLRGMMVPARGDAIAFARQAAIAHAVYTPEVRHPVEVAAAERDHLVTWLSKRLGMPLRTPNLSATGFDLVGGRLLPGNTGPVAQFMYQDARGQRLTLYVRVDATGNRETAFRFVEERGVSVFYWLDRKFGYALSGEIGKDDLLRVANAVYQQLER